MKKVRTRTANQARADFKRRLINEAPVRLLTPDEKLSMLQSMADRNYSDEISGEVALGRLIRNLEMSK